MFEVVGVTSHGVDAAALERLHTRARREIDEGRLPACQLALARDGELVLDEAYGEATVDTRFAVFSCTKAFVAAAVWSLMADGQVDVSRGVAGYLPAFASNGKEPITVEQVMLHTSGFPHAPLGAPDWDTSDGRRRAFARWRLNWEPGTAYEYHASSAHWVLAEIIQEITGEDFREIVQLRVTEPIGLPRVLGIAASGASDVATLVAIGEPATPDELEASLGVRSLPVTEVTDEALLRFNEPAVREVGHPGGGGIMRAADLALFYQALLHDPHGCWPPALLADATGHVRNRFPDPFGVPANRTLGLVQAGDDSCAHLRGFGRTTSPRTFGHGGAGGQIAWADPESGLSFAYVTNGLDANLIRQGRRGVALSSLAASC